MKSRILLQWVKKQCTIHTTSYSSRFKNAPFHIMLIPYDYEEITRNARFCQVAEMEFQH